MATLNYVLRLAINNKVLRIKKCQRICFCFFQYKTIKNKEIIVQKYLQSGNDFTGVEKGDVRSIICYYIIVTVSVPE